MVKQEEGYTYLRSYRYERKFQVSDLLPCQVQALIQQHPRLFEKPYPPRFINNLYLDTPDMDNYFDNVNGAERRRKVRVRWYGEPFGKVNKPMLEIKLKNGLVGTKQSLPLQPFQMDEHFCTRRLQGVFCDSELPPVLREDLRGLEVVLFNRYHRYYHATHDGAFRVTLDSKMDFFKANGLFSNQFTHHQENHRLLIVELKYENEAESQADRVAGFFPFRVTRNSKYVEGIERVYF